MIRYFLKAILCFLSLLFLVNSFALTSENEEKTIDEFIQQFIYTYENRDINKLMGFYSPNAIVIGTGVNEILKGKDEIMEGFKKDFLQSVSANIEASRIAVDITNKFAFISYILNVNVLMPNQVPFQSKLRFSAVLIKDHQKLFIVQSHLSAPLADQKAGDSFPNA